MSAVATPMSLVLVGLLSNFTKKSMKKMLAVSVDETDDELERVILTCRQFAAAAKVKAQIQSGKIEMNQKDDYRYYFKGHQIAGDFLVLACATPIVDIPRDTIRGFFDKILAKWPQSRGFYKDEDYRDAIREQMLAISGMAEASETEEDSKEADILEEDTEVSESDDGRAEGSQSDLDQVSAAVASPITAQPLAARSIAKDGEFESTKGALKMTEESVSGSVSEETLEESLDALKTVAVVVSEISGAPKTEEATAHSEAPAKGTPESARIDAKKEIHVLSTTKGPLTRSGDLETKEETTAHCLDSDAMAKGTPESARSDVKKKTMSAAEIESKVL